MKLKMDLSHFLLLLVSAILINGFNLPDGTESGHCVMRGICGENEFGGIHCVHKSSPTRLKFTTENLRLLTIMESVCPEFLDDFDASDDDDLFVCCDADQIENLYSIGYNYAHLGMQNCPSCSRNFWQIFCHMACSPKQNQFVKINHDKVVKNEYGEHVATEIDVYLDETFAIGAYNSCKDLSHVKGNAVDLMCDSSEETNGETRSECNYKKWFNYLGKSVANNGLLAHQVNFKISNESVVKGGKHEVFVPLALKPYKCNEFVDGIQGGACACKDCPASCVTSEEEFVLSIKRSVNNEYHGRLKLDRYEEEEVKKVTHLAKREAAGKCLMRGNCGESAFGLIPCVSNSDTNTPQPITDPDALEELREMCPHLRDNPVVCCTDEQVIHLNQTFEMLSIFLKECPSCIRNFEKVICHLSCANNQAEFMRITRSEKTDDGTGEMVAEVEYYINEDWAKGVFDSCKSVHRLGFNVLDHYCKPFKSIECDHRKFLSYIGADAQHFGHSPFEVKFVFSNDETVGEFKPAKLPFYQCSDNPHTGEGACPCVHCDASCSADNPKPEIKKQLPKFAPKKGRRK